MFFSWLKNRRRRQLLAEPFPDTWLRHLWDNVRHYQHLPSSAQILVKQVVQVFVAEKNWVGGAGIDVTDEMKVTVAGQAAILVLGLDEPYYFDDVQSLVLYRGRYQRPAEHQHDSWIVREGVPLAGEAWHHGPIVLSWQDVLDSGRNASNGSNVVVHEFAHYLDGLDGSVDGDPPLMGREQQRNWYRMTEAEYRRLLGHARRKEVSLLDHYGASNRAEFFAVATECFFEQPQAMRQKHGELYGVLRDFFRQDPAQWLPDAVVSERAAHSQRSGHRRSVEDPHRQDRLSVLRSRRTNALFSLATEYSYEERYLLAARVFGRVVELAPKDGEAYQQRALARVKLGRYRQALADCKKALRRDPKDQTTYRVRGAAYLGLGKWKRAKLDLDRALDENKQDAEALYLRGRAWAGVGEPRCAVSDFAKSLGIRPLVAEVYYHSGLANRALGDDEEAEADLERAFQLDPLVDQRH